MLNYLKQQIEERRLEKSLSVGSLEKVSGLKKNAIWNILKGRTKKPNKEVLKAIATTLGCTVADLLGDEIDNNILNNKIEPKHKDTYIWKGSLYLGTVSTISQLVDTTNIKFDSNQIIQLIHECYRYSLKKGSDTVDKDFCLWLFEKHFKFLFEK
jgi:transcriptional regulator with XRE-family HTH domain